MIRAPEFWRHGGMAAQMLSPLSGIVAAVTAHRVSRPGWLAPVPVVCCGNATVGGAGKTTLARDIARRLIGRGFSVHLLLRGYRGAEKGPRRVMPGDTAAVAGDEAVLLAQVAPTWTGGDRAASARAAVSAGAQVLVLDDGLQNPSLEKTMSLLVVDGATGFGNGLVLPAGPLREPVAAAASRCRAAILIGPDTGGATARLPRTLPVLRARLAYGREVAEILGRPVFAFAGIAIPDKFFAGLEQEGIELVGREAFPDHHNFSRSDLARLRSGAKSRNAVLVTTQKDAIRLPAGMDVHVISVRLEWETEASIEALLDELLAERRSNQILSGSG
jgi:tetraacyldisaccharide 4'-kinase